MDYNSDKPMCAPSRFEGTPNFTRQTARKEIETFVGNFNPDHATREELFIYQDYLDTERTLVQRNLNVIALAERLYETRTGKQRAIKSAKEDIKYATKRLKDLGVVEKPVKKEPKQAEAKPKTKKKTVVKETSDAVN